jgi:cyclopropane-fatty-acyl-phospholipid synthase
LRRGGLKGGHTVPETPTEHISPTAGAAARRPGWVARLARSLVLKKLSGMTVGEFVIHDGDEEHRFGPGRNGPAVELTVADREFYCDLAFGGSLGAAEGYMLGRWTCSDLTDLVRLMQMNRDVLETVEGGIGQLGIIAARWYHRLRRNTLSGSRRNIVAHYDLSNDFFQLFLDPTMMYSCALFERPGMSLEEASIAKNDRICRKLRLSAGDHLVEIGTGWGGFAIHAASRFGCRVTTTTLSDEQYDLAVSRIADAGLSDRVQVVRKDYRELGGVYDKLVSIEMIEAVGYEYYDDYFGACSRLLKPDGMMCLQAIIIDDRQFDVARRSVDFIQRYVFPGSCIPSITAMCGSVRRATDMRLFHQEDITAYYPPTLKSWRENFFDRIEDVRAMGFSEEFVRMWEFYLCYCEGGFLERWIGDVQMIFTKPKCRCAPILGRIGTDRDSCAKGE